VGHSNGIKGIDSKQEIFARNIYESCNGIKPDFGRYKAKLNYLKI